MSRALARALAIQVGGCCPMSIVPGQLSLFEVDGQPEPRRPRLLTTYPTSTAVRRRALIHSNCLPVRQPTPPLRRGHLRPGLNCGRPAMIGCVGCERHNEARRTDGLPHRDPTTYSIGASAEDATCSRRQPSSTTWPSTNYAPSPATYYRPLQAKRVRFRRIHCLHRYLEMLGREQAAAPSQRPSPRSLPLPGGDCHESTVNGSSPSRAGRIQARVFETTSNSSLGQSKSSLT